MSKEKTGKGASIKNAFIKSVKDTPENWTVTITRTVSDTLLGVVGGAVGAFSGPLSIPVGVVVNGLGSKTGHVWLRPISIGMIAAPLSNFVSGNRKSGDSFFDLDEAKARFSDYLQQLKGKTGLSKVFGSDANPPSTETPAAPQSVNGLSNTNYDALEMTDVGIRINSNTDQGWSSQPSETGNTFADAFAVSGFEDLNTPHII